MSAIEVVVASSVVGVILLAGIVTSQSTIRSTWSSVDNSEQTQQLARLMDGLTQDLGSASKDNLTTTSSTVQFGQEGGEEPVQDGAEYTNLNFRKAVGYYQGQVIYEPAVGKDPCKLWLETDARSTSSGTLMYFDGEDNEVLARDVKSVSFKLDGNRLYINLYLQDDDSDESVLHTRSVYLRSS